MNINSDFFDKKYNKVKELNDKIKSLWDECENETKDCDEVNFEAENLQKEIEGMLSPFVLIKFLDTIIDRPDNMIYEVGKIRLSSSFYKKAEEYDKKIFNLLYSEVYSENYLIKKYNMFSFMYGFSEDKEQKEDLILLKNYLVEKIK
jgi:hypothetical protein